MSSTRASCCGDAYALYDTGSDTAGARWLIHGPAMFPASEFDPLLPAKPLLTWLTEVLGKRGEVAEPPMWTSRYCSELTTEHHAAHDAGGICTVVYFTDGGNLGQIWFRTGHVDISETEATWYPAERPSVEALFTANGRAAARLWSLPLLLLERPAETITLPTPEIAISPAAPKTATPAKVTITLQNPGDFAVQNVLLEVVHLDGANEGGRRHFVIDIPERGSQSVSLDVTFRRGYGMIVVLPFLKDHGIVHDVLGPPLEGRCAIRVVNAAAAPRNYVRSKTSHLSECAVR